MKSTFYLILLLSLGVVTDGYGQYFGERVLEKSFEQTDFFFRPSQLNPYGLDGFGSSAPGLIDDPLLNLQLNPAFLGFGATDSNYAYIDFRNSRKIEDRYGVYPLYRDLATADSRVAYDILPYPGYYIEARQELEPVFSGAYLFRPFGSRASKLWMGLSYQAIFQDDRYRHIPYDIYRSDAVAGFAESDAGRATDISIIDRSSGADDMRNIGHFGSIMAGYAVTSRLQWGVRIGGVAFDRDGEVGAQNIWAPAQHTDESFWLSMENRVQDYNHVDVSTGLLYRLSDQTTAGLTFGRLQGTVDQNLVRQDSSRYAYGVIEPNMDWSRHQNAGLTRQDWNHDGAGTYGGANLTLNRNTNRIVHLYYQFRYEDVDLTSAAAARDTSFSSYRYYYDNRANTGSSNYVLQDIRSGSGRRQGLLHRVAGNVQWQLDDKTHLSFGANVQWYHRQIDTSEDVAAHHLSAYDYDSPYNTNDYSYAQREVKELIWDFDSRSTTVQIPVFLNYEISRRLNLMFGLNRRMTSWKITDVTLALFEFRDIDDNGRTSYEENFGERYTEPTERRSDVQTTFLAGLLLRPSQQFSIRTLVVPNFANTVGDTSLQTIQWWIGFNLNI